MAFSPEPEPLTAASDPNSSGTEPTRPPVLPDGSPEEPALTREQLARVTERLKTGFYDRAEVREQIARRALEDLDTSTR